MNQQIEASCEQSIKFLKRYCQEENDNLTRLAQRLAALFAEGGQLLIAASGCLQPTAQVMASQFVFRLSFNRPALPAVCLGSDHVLNSRMLSEGQETQRLVRHYRAINSQKHLLLVLSDGTESDCLQQLCEDVIDNDEAVAVISFDSHKDPLTDLDVDISLNLGTRSVPRLLELTQFSGHLLCELVESELFGQ